MKKTLEGKISVHRKGFAFIKDDDGKEFFVPKSNRANALHADKVSFIITEPATNENPKAIAQVKEVLEEAREFVVGFTKVVDGRKTLVSDDPKIYERLVIKDFHSLEPDFKILFKIEKVEKGTIFVKKVKDIGHRDALGIDVKTIVAASGIEEAFPITASKEASEIPPVVLDKEKIGRVDLTKEIIITIDSAKAKDLDDAIRVEKLENGNYLLGVYIADVSHYVKQGGAIDKEAFNRATSIYLANRVIPMLPENLSNGICSLNPQVDRLTTSCEMEINSKGEVIDYKIFKALINTTERMTYSDVNKIYEEDSKLIDKYSNISKLLDAAKELAKIVDKRKQASGMLDFDIEESEIIVDKKGQAVDVVLRERGIAEKMIETFMVLANETVAEAIEKMELPSIYRVHNVPPLDRLTEFYGFARHFGEHFEAKQNDVKPGDIKKILDLYRDKPYFFSITIQLLRSMDKAVYSKKNIGHFGLASKSYAHFTSPIRRYPDLILHRIISDYIINEDIDKKAYWNDNLDSMCEHTSDRERRAIDCERAVLAMKKAEWAIKNLHVDFDNSTVVTITEFGMFVKIHNGVEGLLHINELYGDEYKYIDSTFCLKGKEKGKEYKPGDKINIFIKRASKQTGKIDFGLTEYKEITIENDRLRIEKANEEEELRKEQAIKRRQESRQERSGKRYSNYGNSNERRGSGERRYSTERRDSGERRNSGEGRYSNERRGSNERRNSGEGRYSNERRGSNERRNSGEGRYSNERRNSGEGRYSNERRGSGERRNSNEWRGSNERRNSGERKYSNERRGSGERRYSNERRDSGERRYSNERRGSDERRNSGERKYSNERRDSGERRNPNEWRGSNERRNSGERKYSNERRGSGERRYSNERRDSGERRYSNERRGSDERRNSGERKYSNERRDSNKGKDKRFDNKKSFETKKKTFSKSYTKKRSF